MGFNFTGIAINKNYQKDIGQFEKVLNKKFVLIEEINFHNAMSFDKPNNICDIYFAKKCTLAFFSESVQINLDKLSKDRQIAIFTYSEISMTFELKVSDNGKTTRFVKEFNGREQNNEGKTMENEKEDFDISTIVIQGISNTISREFWKIGIEEEEIAFRFKISQLLNK